MPQPRDTEYWEMRAEVELKRAQEATHPAAVKAHYHLANRYLDRIHSDPSTREVDGR